MPFLAHSPANPSRPPFEREIATRARPRSPPRWQRTKAPETSIGSLSDSCPSLLTLLLLVFSASELGVVLPRHFGFRSCSMTLTLCFFSFSIDVELLCQSRPENRTTSLLHPFSGVRRYVNRPFRSKCFLNSSCQGTLLEGFFFLA